MGPFLKSALKYQQVLIASGLALGLVVMTNIALISLSDFWRQLLLGKESLGDAITFQDVMWFFMYYGTFEAIIRAREIIELEKFQKIAYLPAKFEDLIDDTVLTEVIKTAKQDADKKWGMLPYMILQIALQYRTNFSISLISDFLSKQLELFLHQTELKYNKLKYIIWLIPSIGFMGTVYGIGLAVSRLGEGEIDDPELLSNMAQSLGVAFNTTLLALIMSVILQFMMQNLEGREERIINDYGKYVLDNLINKIVGKK